ncbi:DUF5817 domain-containing protein [Salinarchaeum chitinilyticum]
MYAVVGCTECSSLWVLEVGADSATCPRCGKRHRTERLRHFAETEDADDARDARAALVANRRDAGDDAPAFSELEASIDEDVVDDAERLEAAGIDPDAVAAAGERASESNRDDRSQREIVLDAFEVHDQPSADAIRSYADDHGVSRDYVDRMLRKLERSGEVVETTNGYRRI